MTVHPITPRHNHISEDGLSIHQALLDREKSNEARTPVLRLESLAPI